MPVKTGVSAPGTIVPIGALIVPGGIQGVQGVPGTQGVDGQPGPPGIPGAQEVGSIKAWPSVTPPQTWMVMDGSVISRALYPDLFNLIGTTYGAGDGSTTFGLPDARSRFIVAAGQGTGLTNRVLAAVGGEENHVLVTAELASHTHSIATGQFNHSHTISDPGHSHILQAVYIQYQGLAVGSGGNPAYPLGGSNYSNAVSNTTGITGTAAATLPAGVTAAAGTGTGHNTMPPFLVMVYIIKVSAGGGPTAQAPIADQTQPGLMNALSGNASDYVAGDNNCYPLPGGSLWGTDNGTTNACAITVPGGVTIGSLGAGASLSFYPKAFNTGAATLTFNGSSAVPIVLANGGALTGGEILLNTICHLVYDGTNFVLPSLPWSAKSLSASTGSGVTLDCSGASAILIICTFNAAATITLQKLAQGVPICIRATSSGTFVLKFASTTPGGVAYGHQMVTGGAIVDMVGTGVSMASVSRCLNGVSGVYTVTPAPFVEWSYT